VSTNIASKTTGGNRIVNRFRGIQEKSSTNLIENVSKDFKKRSDNKKRYDQKFPS
jgi:uncharacterized protein YhbP (UPF0306 family)